MMFSWQKSAKKHIPKEVPGYDFVRNYDVFIPYKEVRLSVLERQAIALQLVQECVMTSIGAGTHDVADLSGQFGVAEEIMVQILSQLDNARLVGISDNQVNLAPMGRSVLKEQKRIAISKEQSSSLFVNLITGDISETKPAPSFKTPNYSALYLDEEFQADLKFFRDHFDDVADIYNSNITSHIVFRHPSVISAQLYRITDITFSRLFYLRERCAVYINREDRSLIFRFSSGNLTYQEAFTTQLNEVKTGAMRLLNSQLLPEAPEDMKVQPGRPEELINAFGLFCDELTKTSAIEEAFFRDRPLLDGEIADMLNNFRDFGEKAVYLSLPVYSDFLTDTAISALCETVEKLILVHHKTDKSAGYVIEKVKKQFKEKAESSLLVRDDAIPSTVFILFGAACAVRATYVPLRTAYNRRVYRIDGTVTYDPSTVKNYWKTADHDTYEFLYDLEKAKAKKKPRRKVRKQIRK